MQAKELENSKDLLLGGRSTKDTNRPRFKKLLKDIENRVIKTVIVKKLDRLSSF
ncbi:MAG: recombinase family protein [Desulfurella sp.]